MNDINIQSLDADEQKEFIENTAYRPTVLILEDEFEGGSLKLTDEIKQQAKFAIENRIKANRVFTDDKRARIDTSYELVEGRLKEEDLGTDPVFVPETYIAVEKWVDDLYLLYQDLDEKLRVFNTNGDQNKHEIMALESDETEDDSIRGMMDFAANRISETVDVPTKKKKEMYWFRKDNIVKSIIKNGLKKSNFKNVLENFLRMGVIEGRFILKAWPNINHKIVLSAEDGPHGAPGKYKKVKKTYKCLKLTPVSNRNLIYRVDGLSDGAIEIIRNIRFSELAASTFDEFGKSLEEPEYDPIELDRIRDELMNRGGGNSGYDSMNNTIADNQLNSDNAEIDGTLTIAQGHYITLYLPVGKNKKKVPVKCIITVAFLEGEDGEAYPIQVRPYEFEEIMFLSETFVQRDGDESGFGLPELMKPLQREINTLATRVMAILQLAVYGIKIGDKNVIQDSAVLSRLIPDQFLTVELEPGQRIGDAIADFPVNINAIQYAVNMIADLRMTIGKISRKGFSGEKISPDPTATEASAIFRELEKSVDRVALRLNNIFTKLCKMIYEFAILNYSEDSDENIQVDGYFLNDINSDGTPVKVPVKKRVKMTRERFYMEEPEFEFDILNAAQKTGLLRQQMMQFLQLLVANFGIYDPQTGQSRKYTDSNGNSVEINIYEIINNLAELFDLTYDEIWKTLQQQNQVQSQPQQITDDQNQGASPTPDIPPLSATPSSQAVDASISSMGVPQG